MYMETLGLAVALVLALALVRLRAGPFSLSLTLDHPLGWGWGRWENETGGTAWLRAGPIELMLHTPPIEQRIEDAWAHSARSWEEGVRHGRMLERDAQFERHRRDTEGLYDEPRVFGFGATEADFTFGDIEID